MIKVSNRKIIRHIALQELKNSKKMNAVVVMSIILTCLMFTSLTSIGGSLMNGIREETMRQVGGDKMAGVKCVLPEDYEKILSDNAVRNVVYRIAVGRADDENIKDIMVELNCAGSDEAAKSTYCMPTTGTLPCSISQIAAGTLVLDEMGITPEIGTKVPLTIDIDGKKLSYEFELCGYWEGDRVAVAQECWVSRDFADKYAKTPTVNFKDTEGIKYAGYWMVDFDYANSWDIEGKTVELLTRLYGDLATAPNVGINWAYNTNSISTGMIEGAAALLAVIFIAGYLIIYNIFYINISANIRNYGLLKTIGTTSRQIRRIVLIKALIYSSVGIPIGIFTGLFIGRMMLGSIMNLCDIRSSAAYSVGADIMLIACIIAAVFTLITVLVSCIKPCRIAGSVSPIEALRYNDTQINIGKEEKRSSKVTAFSIASGNMRRNKRKVIVVVLSLTLSAVILNSLFTVIGGLDMDKYVGSLIMGDFIVKPKQNSSSGDYSIITPAQLDYISETDGIENVYPIYFGWGNMSLEGTALVKAKKLYEKYNDADEHHSLDSILNKQIEYADVYGISPDILEYMQLDNDSLDTDKFAEGGYAVVFSNYINNDDNSTEDILYSEGDTVELSCIDGKKKTYKVMAVSEMPYPLSTQIYSLLAGQIIIPESDYFELYGNTENGKNVFKVMITVKDGMEEKVQKELSALTDADGSQLLLTSKQTYAEEYSDFLKMLKLVGGMLSAILTLIGILNFINSITTGILARKRELAMMEAVGMTSKQLKSMLVWEGSLYTIFTAVTSLVIGAVLSLTAVRAAAEVMYFFAYKFTIMPIVIIIPILLVFSALIPYAAYTVICKESVVDRMKANDI